MKYLIDTNICIYYMKGRFELDSRFESAGTDSLFISGIQILPIFDALDIYAREKARLRKEGQLVDDFDLLIGASAIANDLTLVTNNEKHFERLTGIRMTNWTK